MAPASSPIDPRLDGMGRSGTRSFAGWMATSRDNEKYSAQNIGCFYGLGNHGGGPSRRQLDDIRRWADKNPQVEVIHSGLHRFFDAILAEERERGTGYPVHRGELNFCLRGCYASVAKFKFPLSPHRGAPRARGEDQLDYQRLARAAAC